MLLKVLLHIESSVIIWSCVVHFKLFCFPTFCFSIAIKGKEAVHDPFQMMNIR
jgi:hypothetical protein